MSSPFEVCCLLSHGRARVIGILRTMCHVITEVTANHRLSSRTVRVLPVRQFAVRSSLNTHTPEVSSKLIKLLFPIPVKSAL